MIKGKHLSRKVKEAELEKVQEKKNTEKENMLKEAEPRTDYTDRQCLAICINTKYLKNPQHRCCICKQTVIQTCSCNVEDPLLDKLQHV